MPLNLCDFFEILRQVRMGFLCLGSLLPLIGRVITEIRLAARNEGRLERFIELLDLGDTASKLKRGVDPVFGMTRGLVDDGRPEGTLSRELEGSDTHGQVVGQSTGTLRRSYVRLQLESQAESAILPPC